MNRNSQVQKVAIAGMAGNILLLGAKLTVGFFTGSQAMIADGLNSAGDVFASLMTYIGNRISAKPGDEDHPYGHGKAEYIFSMIISFSLLLVAFTIFRAALDTLISGERYSFSPFLIAVAAGTILLKFFLFIFANRVGHEQKSLLAIANAQDHRNDMFISGLTLISAVLGYFNIYTVDSIGGMIIAFWIAFTGFEIFTSAYNVLMDKNVDNDLMDEFSEMINAIEGVDHIDAIVAKPIGPDFLLIVKVSIDAHITVHEGHDIACQVKEVLETLDHVQDVIVHVNPTQYHPERMERKKDTD